MPYTPTTWTDLPSLTTPITAAQLQRIESAIRASLWNFSARDYGAVLNDSTDDSAAIQAAVNAASAAGGGWVMVDGRANCGTTTITHPSKVWIVGVGWEASWMRRASGTNVLLDMSGTATGGANHKDHQGLANISLRGSGTSATLLRAYYVSRARILDVFFYNNTGIGTDVVEGWDMRFTRCHWNDVGGTATTNTPNTNTATPQVWIRNSAAASGFGNGTDNSNMIWFTDCHWESNNNGAGMLWVERGHAANASNPNGIFITHGKFEHHKVRNILIVVGDPCSLVHFRDCDVVMGAFDSGVSTAVDGMLVGGVSNISLDGIRFVGVDGVQSMSNGIEFFGQSNGSYRIASISHEGQNPTSALVNIGGLFGKFDIGVVTSSATATLFAGSHPNSPTFTVGTATHTPALTAPRCTQRISMTGNVTVAAPTGPIAVGDRLTFVWTQDATGGRTVTWNGVFKVAAAWVPVTTANKVNAIEFEWNGTNWVTVSVAINQ